MMNGATLCPRYGSAKLAVFLNANVLSKCQLVSLHSTPENYNARKQRCFWRALTAGTDFLTVVRVSANIGSAFRWILGGK